MIRLLFVAFVCVAGFAALALWNLRSGDTRAVVEEMLSGGVATTAVQAEVERLNESLAALLPEIVPIGGESAGDEMAETDTDDSGSGGNGEAEVLEFEPVVSEFHRAEIVPSKPSHDAASTEVHDVAPAADFAQDLGGPNDVAEFEEPAADGAPPRSEPWFTEASLDEAERAKDSADLIRRMLAVYSRTQGGD